MNRKIVVLLVFLIVTLLFLVVFSFSNKTSRQNPKNPSIPTFSTPSPSASPVGTQTIRDQQNSWAQNQSQYNQENPWHSKLPLKSNDYFISYDPTHDSFIATVYYSPANPIPKDQQIANSKTEALSAIKNLDPSLVSKPVTFIPTAL